MIEWEETTRELRILDFDCEARPLSWLAQDYVTKEVTVIAAKFVGDKGRAKARAIGTAEAPETRYMLEWFLELYEQADMVTGHYIRGFDLPLINGALEEHGMPSLAEKLSSDTKGDLLKRHGMSNSQESLGAELGLKHPKVQMTQNDWRQANRLTAAGIRKAKNRCIGDVEQHIELRDELIKRGRLGPPKLWQPGPYGTAKYHA